MQDDQLQSNRLSGWLVLLVAGPVVLLGAFLLFWAFDESKHEHDRSGDETVAISEPDRSKQTTLQVPDTKSADVSSKVEEQTPKQPDRTEPVDATKEVHVRPAILAGSWYPASKEQLRRSIETYLEGAETIELGRPLGFIAPHAGHSWSGPTAAYTYKSLQGRSFHRVFVLAPNHKVYVKGAVIPSVDAFETPLGRIPLNMELLEALAQEPLFAMDDTPHASEHAIEIQLPFMQVALEPGYLLVPIIIGEIDVEESRQLAATLRPFVGPDDLVIVSSDFTHYGRRFGYMPFDSDVAKNLRKLDMGAYAAIENLSEERLAEYRTDTNITVCGYHPILVLLALLPDTSRATLLKYDTSGNNSGDFSNSVSYMSIAFTGPPWSVTNEKPRKNAYGVIEVGGPPVLSILEQRYALKLARRTVESVVTTGQIPTLKELEIEPTGALLEEYGVFVTLKKNGQLRGCIGNILPRAILVEGIIGRAKNAAMDDGRFTPVTPDELSQLEVEISILTPPRRVDSFEQIEIGRHGVVLTKGRRSAVFLPQVAPEQGWDVEQTLSHLSRKAGLSSTAWKEGATFEVFEAQVFMEAHD